MCFDKAILYRYDILFIFFEILLAIFFVVGYKKGFFKFKNKLYRAAFLSISIFGFLVTSTVGFFLILVFYERLNDNNASYYFPLNAAIKNTCYLDSAQLNCPKNLNELISIESENFESYRSNSYLAYEYRPASNEYTLVALEKNTNRGAIFDPRLVRLPNYGYDFVDVTYKTCNGKKVINNPPPIEGIWEDMEK